MRKLIFLLFVLAGTSFAQLGRFDGSVLPTGTPNGPANVAVCLLNGTSGPPCTPLAVIYDQSGAPDQNPFPADMNGRYNFYAQPGTYVVQTYGTGYTTTATTVTISVPGSAPGVNPAAVVGPVFNPKNYGAKGDARSVIDGVTSNGSATVTSATANWSSADVGKEIWCNNTAGTNALPVTTIASVQSATSITAATTANSNAGSAQMCVWGTQDDTAAISATSTAAINGVTSANGMDAEFGPALVRPGTVYVPGGGYIVSGNIYNFNATSQFTAAPNFIGEGRSQTIFYLAPTYSLATAPLVNVKNGTLFNIENLNIQGSMMRFTATASELGIIELNQVNNCYLGNIEADNIGLSTTSNQEVLDVANGVDCTFVNLFIRQGPANDLGNGAMFTGGGGNLLLNPKISNHINNLIFANGPARNTGNEPTTVVNGFIDECGVGNNCTFVTGGAQISFVGTTMMGANSGRPLEVNGAGTIAWLTDDNIGAFTTASNVVGINIETGGTVFAAMSTIRGNGSSAAVANAGTFYDVGGNTYQNCSNTTCTTATIAQAFSGTQPIAALTHSATNPFIPTDTAQTWMQMTPDQPIRITRIQVTPANGASVSCTVTPVFQITNGTTTQTQNIANATATDDSGAITTGNTYVAGTAITFGISAAGTCTTPPTNMNVNVMWQSVAPSQ